MAAAAADEWLDFTEMGEAELRQWVEANPGGVNDRDSYGTPMVAAAMNTEGLSLIVWLLDEKGADMNATLPNGYTALHYARTADILTALLDRRADPTMVVDNNGWPPLMYQAYCGSLEVVARLLEGRQVRAAINVQDRQGNTALHYACCKYRVTDEKAALNVHMLLQAGANPVYTNKNGQTPVSHIQQRYPDRHATIALLEQALAEAETWLLVKARRLAVAVTSNTTAPSFLQARVARGQPLPHVAMTPAMSEGFCGMLRTKLVFLCRGEGFKEDHGADRQLRAMLAFLVGRNGGHNGQGMPRDVFGVVSDFLKPSWDPLRRGTGTRQSQG